PPVLFLLPAPPWLRLAGRRPPMASRVPGWLRALSSGIPTVLVLGALAGLAVLGSANDWKLNKLSAYWGAEEEEDEGKDKKAEETVFLGAPLTFPDERHAHTAGIEVEPARLRTMIHEVRATGVLAFDQTRHAQLATRVPGTAWRVPRKAGDRVKKGDVLAVVSSADASKVRADLLSSLAQHQIKADVLR